MNPASQPTVRTGRNLLDFENANMEELNRREKQKQDYQRALLIQMEEKKREKEMLKRREEEEERKREEKFQKDLLAEKNMTQNPNAKRRDPNRPYEPQVFEASPPPPPVPQNQPAQRSHSSRRKSGSRQESPPVVQQFVGEPPPVMDHENMPHREEFNGNVRVFGDGLMGQRPEMLENMGGINQEGGFDSRNRYEMNGFGGPVADWAKPQPQALLAPIEPRRSYDRELNSIKDNMKEMHRNFEAQLEDVRSQAMKALQEKRQAEEDLKELREKLHERNLQTELYQQNLRMALAKQRPAYEEPLVRPEPKLFEALDKYQPQSQSLKPPRPNRPPMSLEQSMTMQKMLEGRSKFVPLNVLSNLPQSEATMSKLMDYDLNKTYLENSRATSRQTVDETLLESSVRDNGLDEAGREAHSRHRRPHSHLGISQEFPTGTSLNHKADNVEDFFNLNNYGLGKAKGPQALGENSMISDASFSRGPSPYSAGRQPIESSPFGGNYWSRPSDHSYLKPISSAAKHILNSSGQADALGDAKMGKRAFSDQIKRFPGIDISPLENASQTVNLEAINRKNDARLKFLSDFQPNSDQSFHQGLGPDSFIGLQRTPDSGSLNLSKTDEIDSIRRMVSDYRP